MNEASPIPTPTERHSSWVQLPRPLWIGLVTIALIVVGTGLRFGLPTYRQQVAIREIERQGGTVEFEPKGPEWLRGLLGARRMEFFDDVIKVDLSNRGVNHGEIVATDDVLRHVGRLLGVTLLDLSDAHITD